VQLLFTKTVAINENNELHTNKAIYSKVKIAAFDTKLITNKQTEVLFNFI